MELSFGLGGTIRFMAFPLNKATESIEQSLKDLNSNQLALGYPGVQFVNTDNCCQDRKLFEAVFPSLALPLEVPNHPALDQETSLLLRDVRGYRSNRSRLPPFANPARIVVVETRQACDAAVENILDILDLCEADFKVIGYDQEWVPFRTTGLPISVIQIAPFAQDAQESIVYLFSVKNLTKTMQFCDNCSKGESSCTCPTPSIKPKLELCSSLADLLARSDIKKTGCNLKGDATRYRKMFGDSSFPSDSILDLRDLFLERVGPQKNISLQLICSKLLGLYLSKPAHVRLSDNWEGVLTREERE